MTSEETKDIDTSGGAEASKAPSADHDSAYRQLYSHPVMLQDLVRRSNRAPTRSWLSGCWSTPP